MFIETNTLYRCTDADGHTYYANKERAAQNNNCRVLSAEEPLLSAISVKCDSPSGRTFGLPGELERTIEKEVKVVDTADKMVGGYVRISWTAEQSTKNTITLNAGSGGPDFEAPVTLVRNAPDQITFLVMGHGISAPYLYTYYPKAHVVISSTHDTGALLGFGGARSKSFLAHCREERRS